MSLAGFILSFFHGIRKLRAFWTYVHGVKHICEKYFIGSERIVILLPCLHYCQWNLEYVSVFFWGREGVYVFCFCSFYSIYMCIYLSVNLYTVYIYLYINIYTVYIHINIYI
jgi:hypothetical protein